MRFHIIVPIVGGGGNHPFDRSDYIESVLKLCGCAGVAGHDAYICEHLLQCDMPLVADRTKRIATSKERQKK